MLSLASSDAEGFRIRLAVREVRNAEHVFVKESRCVFTRDFSRRGRRVAPIDQSYGDRCFAPVC